MFLLNSCLSLFSAACLRRHPFSLSYGVILPSSLTMLLPPALGSSPCPPVSVYGTGPCKAIAAFLGSQYASFPTHCFGPHRAPAFPRGVCLPGSPCTCTGYSFPGLTPRLRPHSSVYTEYRNLNLLSIGYASQPRLRSRLTQGRSALPWKPRIFGL